MSNKTKQSVAVAMATALSVSTLISPLQVLAKEEEPFSKITQQDSKEKIEKPIQPDTLTPLDQNPLPQTKVNAEGAFETETEVNNALYDALNAYEKTNEITEQDVLNFLNQEFITTGKLKEFRLIDFQKEKATTEDAGVITLIIDTTLINGTTPLPHRIGFSLIIPRLPKDGEVAVSSANFPDPAFKEYVKTEFDKDKDDVLSNEEIDKVKEFSVSAIAGLKDITGIEHFRELKRLICSNTQLETIDVSKNKKLQDLYCSNIPTLTTLIVDGADALIEIQCYSTGITELNVRNNSKLNWLACYKTNLNSLDVSNNANLEVLDCFSNPYLTEIKTNKHIKILNVSETSIRELNLSDYTELTNLQATRNPKLETLDIRNASSLEELWANDSPALSSIITGNNTALTKLSLFNDIGLRSLDISSMENIDSISADNASLIGLDASHNFKLDSLNMPGVALAYLNLPEGVVLSSLGISRKHSIPITISGSSFKLTDIYPDFQMDKFVLLRGASQDGETLSGYKNGEPIEYIYIIVVRKVEPKNNLMFL